MIHGAGLGLTFLAQILLARTLGPSDYGIYAFVLSWLMILAGLATIGFDRAAVRFVAGYVELRAWAALRGFSDMATRLVTIVALSVAGLAIIVALVVPLEPEIPLQALLLGAVAIPFLTFVRLESGRMRGYGAVIRALFPDYVVRDGLVVLGLLLLLLGAPIRPGPLFPLALTLLGCLIGAGLARYWRRQLEPDALSVVTKPDTSKVRLWLSTALGLGAVTLVQVSLQRIDVILLTTFATPTEAGIFNAAFTLANLALFPMLAANIAGCKYLFRPPNQPEFSNLKCTGCAGRMAAHPCW